MLEVKGLSAHYGRIRALEAVDFSVQAGELIAVIGANGAGKTTLLRALSGVLPRSGGSILFKGQDVSRAAPHRRVKLGIAQVPEGRQMFAPMSVEDNLRLGAFTRHHGEHAAALDEAYAMFPRLKERRRQPSGTLSGGEQQMLAIARALMSKPSLLLLDEPSMGLAPRMVGQVFETVVGLREQGVTMLLVEQNAFAALAIAERAHVLESGRIVLAGTAEELRANDRVRTAYLGL